MIGDPGTEAARVHLQQSFGEHKDDAKAAKKMVARAEDIIGGDNGGRGQKGGAAEGAHGWRDLFALVVGAWDVARQDVIGMKVHHGAVYQALEEDGGGRE